ncbi:MAG: hypothetical protein WBN04_17465 [Paracoccaceae bacterium]
MVTASSIEKAVGPLLMLAVESDGASFLVNGSSHEFHVTASHANYAAMFSQLLAAQSNGSDVAVKYNPMGIAQQGNRRSVVALATGVNAIIIGVSF